MLELIANKECTGLGYNSQNLEMPASIATKGLMLPLSKYFSSVGYLDDNRICTVEEDKEEGVGMIFTKTDGRGVTKWIGFEIPKVILIKM